MMLFLNAEFVLYQLSKLQYLHTFLSSCSGSPAYYCEPFLAPFLPKDYHWCGFANHSCNQKEIKTVKLAHEQFFKNCFSFLSVFFIMR
jgi:hypothetical protein